ncbi:pyruvate dehydrogenase [Amycolatopsis cihanbeyliensis]|uniref:Pyruvate dehydrogenase (Quinone) n=1 Tax=Amycolatopsis cihanbeyliensis TaxID=1128664 RepID=A0A542CTZ2_AMYCI|nr:pyruvate dehydrogenase [Amycolatopsis cihanbeyliensis]TQI94291.1 pyruvate dehydrogenase (quinone) [Amycolatopsis cihanbeyliensis]
MRRTVAEHLVTTLRDAGVQRIYGLVGDSLNPVVDAVRRIEGIEWVHVHNEEAAAFAAGAEATLTGRLAVCAASCGPGNTHLVQGLYDAQRNGAPVLAIATHIPAHQIGTGFFQETHPERLFVECSHYCELVTGPGHAGRVLHIAMQHAIGRSGVAVLVLPGDIAHEAASGPAGYGALAGEPAVAVPPRSQVAALAEAINRADTVTLFAGAGVRGAHAEVVGLAEHVLAPIGHALGGKEWIQYDNPFDVGMSGLLGYGACYEASQEADLLVLLGTDFPYDDFLPQGHTAQVDHDPTKFGRRCPVDVVVQGDVGTTIRALLPLLERKTDRAFLDRMLHKHTRALEQAVSAYTRNIEHQVPIHPEYVASVLDDLAAEDAVFTVDTGMCNVWAARYLTPNGRRRVIGSWRHGTMANALPHAIGAQASHPGRQVVSLSGDGGLGMLLGELLTVRLHRLPVKIVLFNNASLGMVKLEMLVDGIPDYQTDHEPVDFTAIADAVGIPATRVTEPERVRPALRDGLAADGPALIEMVTDANALSMPPRITADQVRGFALATSKIVLSGGVGRMLDLARSNLRNIPRR